MTDASFTLSLSARPESATIVRHVLAGVVEAWGVSHELLRDVQIAVGEACANVVRHAYPEGTTGFLGVDGSFDDGRVVVAVTDNGPGVTPDPTADGLGLGLPLMGALTDRLEFGRTQDGAHEVRLVFPGTGT